MPGRAFMLCQLLLLGLGSQGTLPPPCDSRIYCYGELLHQVQMAKLYQDDKQFVDMPPSSTPDRVLQHFRELAARHNHSIPTPLLRAFIQEHFQAAGQELQPWTLEDWKDSPRFLQKISDPKLRIWGEQLHQLWKKLGKKVKPEVLSHPEQFSLCSTQNTPSLCLVGALSNSTAGYGHVPNGARVYSLQRSQRPLLTLMMHSYVAHTKDTAFLRDNIETLALELDFWTEHRNVSGPRDQEALWAELKAGAESGWDFSSRWLVKGLNPNLLSSIQTSKLVPVDLNAFLCQAEELMSDFYSRPGNMWEQLLAAMKAILWDEENGAWFDYDLENRRKNLELYPSNLSPLWSGCFSDPGVVDKALNYLEVPPEPPGGGSEPRRESPGRGPSGFRRDSQILTYQYRIPTSLQKTGQQWDFPSAWAPLQDLVIREHVGFSRGFKMEVLRLGPLSLLEEMAFQLAQNWIRTNFEVYSRKSAMYEKYDISNGGQPGGGGEYEVQEGFGWTSGVVLMLLDRYDDRLSSGTQTAFLVPQCLTTDLLLSLLPRLPH
ncbi:LOW QUALITY PROTEIN: trehalase [Prionailurus iriomotensis]